MPTGRGRALRANRRRLYWDSSCFIALYNREPTTDHAILSALSDTYADMLGGHLQIVTSDIFRFEVQLETAENSQLLWDRLRGCRHFEFLIKNQQVEDLALELKVRAQANQRRIQMADAFHIATAILSRSEALWTTDRRMLKHGTAGMYPEIRIVLPSISQPRLWVD